MVLDIDTQVLVVGGGPAGVATAIALKERGLSVAMVDKSDYDDIRVGEHLLPIAYPLLSKLNIPRDAWDAESYTCAQVRSAWGTSKLSSNESIWSSLGGGALLTRPTFDSGLAKHAEKIGVTVYRKTTLSAFDRADGKWDLTLNDGEQKIKADFLVDATGRPSKITQALGGRPDVYDKLIGLCVFVEPKPSANMEDKSILIETCEDGWWYSARLYYGTLSVAFMTDSDMLSSSGLNPIDYYNKMLCKSCYTRSRIENYKSATKAYIRPAQTQLLDRFTGDGWLAVGDAAISCDPLSSAGIYKGFVMGIAAAEAINSQMQGDRKAFERYVGQVKEIFEEYLQTRGHYYRLVTRWPKSKFWNRRFSPLPKETSISLDPLMQVTLSEKISSSDDYSALKQVIPVVDMKLLLELASQTKLAYQLASLYRSEAKCKDMDTEIIQAIQFLIGSGHLIAGSPSIYKNSEFD